MPRCKVCRISLVIHFLQIALEVSADRSYMIATNSLLHEATNQLRNSAAITLLTMLLSPAAALRGGEEPGLYSEHMARQRHVGCTRSERTQPLAAIRSRAGRKTLS